MTVTPILFLDFDGVTHPEVCTAPELFICLPRIEEVLLRHPQVEIVISSAWREYHPIAELQQHFCPQLRPRVVGCTPLQRQDPREPAMCHVREVECRAWLTANRPDAAWLAIDDAPWLFSPRCAYLLLTNHAQGFTDEDAVLLDKRLGLLLSVKLAPT